MADMSKLEAAAKAAHEMNRLYCTLLSDNSQLPWEDAPDWQKESCIAGVKAIVDNPEITPAEQHKIWMRHKVAEGWKFGSLKDVEKKEHPYLVEYYKLLPEQRAKDAIFGAVVRGILGI